MVTPQEKAIVIVDDEMSFTELLANMLGAHFDCPVLIFNSPLAALKALAGVEIGVLVTDYYMPHVNGLDLIARIGALAPTPPNSILITGHIFEEEPDQPPSFKATLAKPFRWQQLARLIESHWPGEAGAPLRPGIGSLQA